MGGAVALETRSPGRAPHGALDGGFLSPLLPQLLNSLSVDPDAECKHGLYFRDGRRKVDYLSDRVQQFVWGVESGPRVRWGPEREGSGRFGGTQSGSRHRRPCLDFIICLKDPRGQ